MSAANPPQSHAPGPPRGPFRAALAMVMGLYPKDNQSRVAREIGTTARIVAAWIDGTREPGPQHVAGLLRFLARTAATPQGDAERAPWIAAARAIDVNGYITAHRHVRQERLLLRAYLDGHLANAKGHPKTLEKGVHVLPFRNEQERPLLARIDREGRLVALAPFAVEGPEPDKIRLALWERGVHFAPWRPSCERGDYGHVLLAIDSDSRLRAMVDVPADYTGSSLIDAYDDLIAALEMLDPPSVDAAGLVAEYGREKDDPAPPGGRTRRDDDGDFDAGDVWRKGTIYDHRRVDDDVED